MKNYIVYKTTNILNNKLYLGVHEQVGNTFDGYLGSGSAVLKAIKKYGKKNFIRETLYSYSSREEALNKEKELVTPDIVKNKNYYNLTVGGYGDCSNCHTLEAQQKSLITRKENARKLGRDLGYNLNTPEAKKNHRKSILKKYGKIAGQLYTKEALEKSFSTRLERYGDLMVGCRNRELRKKVGKKSKKTKLSRYGDPMGLANSIDSKIKARKTRDLLALEKYPDLKIKLQILDSSGVVINEGIALKILQDLYGTKRGVKSRKILFKKLKSGEPWKQGPLKGLRVKKL